MNENEFSSILHSFSGQSCLVNLKLQLFRSGQFSSYSLQRKAIARLDRPCSSCTGTAGSYRLSSPFSTGGSTNPRADRLLVFRIQGLRQASAMSLRGTEIRGNSPRFKWRAPCQRTALSEGITSTCVSSPSPGDATVITVSLCSLQPLPQLIQLRLKATFILPVQVHLTK